MQLTQQLLAAILNHAAFGSIPLSDINSAISVLANPSATSKQVKDAMSMMAVYNEAGDNLGTLPNVAAQGSRAKNAADIQLWDVVK
jgi:hypothetical protein